jgi:cytochrome o ubiquinol oxidase subunit I
MFGKITLNDLTFLHDPIVMGATIMMFLGAAAIIGLLFYYKKWTWLWTEWITTVDHKKIGTMYIIAAVIMLLRGFSDALLMRAHQALAAGESVGFLPPEHYDQIFTAHGVIMIFFVAMPFMFGLLNWIVPLQIGARDVAFPFLNSLSFWLFAVSAVLINISLFLGEFAATGWLAYPPLSGLLYSPGVGVDYYIWAIQISGLGSLMSGINFFVTIIKMRCPGMSLMKMPIFTWTALCSMILVIITFPVLTATLGMLFLDRFLDMHFFTSDFGGNPMMYINLIWIWGHPEVYILVLPAFGVYSEVVATFCKKKLFGYGTMVWATIAIVFLSFVVWLHHFFTMGAGANVNAFFGIMTMIIAVPTGVKVFNWLFTMYHGRIHFTNPMILTIGFLITFAIGGMTGVLLSVPPVDFQLHNSLFLVAHFHNVIVGGVLFGYFAGFIYWFPKFFAFKLNEKLGNFAFTAWIVGFFVAFMPLYYLGLMGMSRRISHYSDESGWQPWLILAAVGSLIIAVGVIFQVLQFIVSLINRNKEEYKDATGDPWDGRTLEWDTTSPPAFYNFALTPTVTTRDAFWEHKKEGIKPVDPNAYEDIHMPKNSSLGFIISVFAFLFGFGIIWHMMWLVAVGLLGCFIGVMARSFDYNIDYYVSASEVAAIEAARYQAIEG